MRRAATTGHASEIEMPFNRAYTKPAAPSAIQPMSRAAWKARSDLAIALILASVLLAPSKPMAAQEAPANLARLVAHRESETEAERNEYTYRQTVTIDELDDHGGPRGQYREVRDIIFSPQRERTEEVIGKPQNGLKALVMTEEDFR